MPTRVLSISGMTCGHCAQAVTRSLSAVAGVTKVLVDLERNEAQVDGDAEVPALIHAVTKEGYGAIARAG